ncbi:hypothetical protein IFM89_036885 [Coptis chinensis]|uniref:Uncharacterized protein n=1 Tax=Coptis chinensis TaxID=261450 RepID=A0A835LTF9_9MAGN|nr:hypothetical protein IFM89_036885 [Coptis chinensis]
MQIQKEEQEQDMKSHAQILNHMCGIVDSVVLKCAVELNLFDVISNNKDSKPIALSSLATPPTLVSIKPNNLYRLLRYLVHMNLLTIHVQGNDETFSLTELSKLLLRDQKRSLVDWALAIIDETVIDGWHELSGCCTSPAGGPTPFERVHGKSVWELAGENAGMNQVINDAMVSDTILVMPVFVQCCDKLLNRITSMVDIGGGVGMTMSSIFMLHNWHDKECITILKKCKEVIPQDKGKEIILDIVTDQNEQDDDLTRAKMNLDIGMMVTSGGRERTENEWEVLLKLAGFSRHEIIPIMAVQSVIVAYP